jgi:hypothetical protein
MSTDDPKTPRPQGHAFGGSCPYEFDVGEAVRDFVEQEGKAELHDELHVEFHSTELHAALSKRQAELDAAHRALSGSMETAITEFHRDVSAARDRFGRITAELVNNYLRRIGWQEPDPEPSEDSAE